MEESATYFYVQSDEVPANLVCNNAIASSGYSATEPSYVPNYACLDQSSGTLNGNGTWSTSMGANIDTFHVRSFHWDNNHGDYSRLYRFELWVR